MPIAVPTAEDMRFTIERLVACLDLLERGNVDQTTMDVTLRDVDETIQERTPDRDFLPYARFREALPSIQRDFFRSQTQEADRKNSCLNVRVTSNASTSLRHSTAWP
jgi:hypothetical protein